jgi:hypothetical protein
MAWAMATFTPSGPILGQVQQQYVAAGALDQRANRRVVPGAHDEVALPVSWHHLVHNLTRASEIITLVGDLPLLLDT